MWGEILSLLKARGTFATSCNAARTPLCFFSSHINDEPSTGIHAGSRERLMGVKIALFVLPASLFFLFQICQKSGISFGSWLCLRSDMSLELRARIREKTLLCTPVPRWVRWINGFNRVFGQVLDSKLMRPSKRGGQQRRSVTVKRRCKCPPQVLPVPLLQSSLLSGEARIRN